MSESRVYNYWKRRVSENVNCWYSKRVNNEIF